MSTTDYSAVVIADSINLAGHRLTTLEVTYPRFVHSEFMTHRWFSRNAASSRAIPVKKSIERVRNTPSYPVHWGAEKPGMQPGDSLGDEELRQVKYLWDQARVDMALRAETLTEMGLHKSLVNRIIEPWSWITVIVSSTDWENFFAQRATSRTPLAQPELARAADLMEAAVLNSKPETLDRGEWHMPYIDHEDWLHAADLAPQTFAEPESAVMVLCKVSVARCARVSLLTHDGKRDLSIDLDLYGKLVSASPMHASPLEHVAHPDPQNAQAVPVVDFRWNRASVVGHRDVPKLGNFLGWAQLRHMVEETRA